MNDVPVRRPAPDLRQRADRIAAAFLAHPSVAPKLAGLPEMVRAEVESEVRGRAMGAATQGRDRISWAQGDSDLCRQRVLARLRVARFGRMPADAGEWERQMAEVEGELERRVA